MQQEIDAAGWPVEVRILGVNLAGLESANDLACEGNDIPWLQETAEALIWEPWGAGYRDVIILDQDNVALERFNLTTHDLSDPGDYAALTALLAGHAGAR
jgi:hypothetical protein